MARLTTSVGGVGATPSAPQQPQAQQQLTPEQLAQMQQMIAQMTPEQQQSLLGGGPVVTPDAPVALSLIHI